MGFWVTFRTSLHVLPSTYSGSAISSISAHFYGLSCPSRHAFSSDFKKVHFLTTSVTFSSFCTFLVLGSDAHDSVTLADLLKFLGLVLICWLDLTL